MSTPQLWTTADAAQWITIPNDEDDKYSRGVVGFATGSLQYPGAAIIGVDAAMHTGVGMVRYAGPHEVGELVLQRRPETVLESGRSQAWVIGSGMSGAPEFELAEMPGTAFILDAGAIGASPTHPGPTILTPHAGELARLLGISRADVHADPIGMARRAGIEFGVAVMLKGATTHVVAGERVISVRAATPWLATAGAGDALAGVLGALTATRGARGAIDLDDLACLGASAALIHGTAARLAAGLDADGAVGGPFAVLELNSSLPAAIRRVLSLAR